MGKRTNTAVWMEKYNRWQVNVQKDGLRRSFTSSKPGRTGQREANAKADAWLDEGILSGSRKVSQIMPDFLEDLEARTSQSHYRPVAGRISKWVLPTIGNVKISSLTDQHLQKVINQAYSQGHLSQKTLKNLRADMHSFIKFCRKSRLTTYMPEDIVIPASAEKQIKLILQPADLAVLLSDDTTLYRGNVVPEPYINGYRLQVLTGLRPGELLGLRTTDRSGDVVHVQRSLNAYGEITAGKNENARRTIVLTAAAQQCWDKQVSESFEGQMFPLANQQTYYKHLRTYCQFHGLPDVSPYELRHTFVSLAKTLPEGLVKDLVGHSKQMDTFGVYGHAVDGQKTAIKTALESAFQTLIK